MFHVLYKTPFDNTTCRRLDKSPLASSPGCPALCEEVRGHILSASLRYARCLLSIARLVADPVGAVALFAQSPNAGSEKSRTPYATRVEEGRRAGSTRKEPTGATGSEHRERKELGKEALLGSGRLDLHNAHAREVCVPGSTIPRKVTGNSVEPNTPTISKLQAAALQGLHTLRSTSALTFVRTSRQR